MYTVDEKLFNSYAKTRYWIILIEAAAQSYCVGFAACICRGCPNSNPAYTIALSPVCINCHWGSGLRGSASEVGENEDGVDGLCPRHYGDLAEDKRSLNGID